MKLKFTFNLAAGILSLTFGVLLLGTWIFLMTRPEHTPFGNQPTYVAIHIVTQLVTSLGLLIAGAMLLMKKRLANKVFLSANAFLFLAMIYAGLEYSSMVHPFFTYQLSIASIAVLTYGLGLVYFWEHFIFKMEKSRPNHSIKSRFPKKPTHKMA